MVGLGIMINAPCPDTYSGRYFFNEEQEKTEVLFIGDPPNDCPMFQAFPISVGVANVLDFKTA